MTKKQFRKFKKDGGNVFSDGSYQQHRDSGVERSSNLTCLKKVLLIYILKKCVDSWPILKATGCQGFTIFNHYVGKRLCYELKKRNIPAELVSVKKYKR